MIMVVVSYLVQFLLHVGNKNNLERTFSFLQELKENVL